VHLNNTSAHNVANVNTRGYTARSTVQAETAPSGTRIAAVRRRGNVGGPSSTDLALEAGRQTTSRHAVTANAAVIRKKDQMLGSLLDLVG
jgi:flagellar hook-associated protein FlgK